jgi:hypothetical protein
MKGQGETMREDRFEGKSERAKFGIWGYVVFESPVAQPEKRPQLDWTCGRLQPGTGCSCLLWKVWTKPLKKTATGLDLWQVTTRHRLRLPPWESMDQTAKDWLQLVLHATGCPRNVELN